MSLPSPFPVLPLSTIAAKRLGLAFLTVAILVLLGGWTRFGLAFYGRVIPFYDSLSYQDGYWEAARQASQQGVAHALVQIWREPNNVVLYKFFAAAFGGLLPAGKSGLYVYLYGIHLAALFALVRLSWRASGSIWTGLWALAAWLSATPFSQLRHGIADQRMDLASAAFYLLLVALGLAWSRAPDRLRAAGFGVVAALAVLHRPVIAASVVGIAILFVTRAALRGRRSARDWACDTAWLAGPGLLLAAPWLLAHASNLHRYYFVVNVDVGSAPTFLAAATYNASRFWAAFGPAYATLLGVGFLGIWLCQRVDWLDVAGVVIATLLPLAMLVASRSSGNMLVAQLSLGVPALLLSCGRRCEQHPREGALPLLAAMAAVSLVIGASFRSLNRELAGVRVESRREAVDVLRQIAAKIPSGRLAAFQASPIDVVGLISISHELDCDLSVGTYAFHPTHFGIGNDQVAGLSTEARQEAVRRILEAVKRRDSLLMLPTADTENRLLPLPFSHSLIPVVRQRVEADPAFVKVVRTTPIEGMCFDVFSVRRQ